MLTERGHDVSRPWRMLSRCGPQSPNTARTSRSWTSGCRRRIRDEGLRAAIDIRRDHPGTGVLLFSQYVETRYATRLLAAGSAGVGYLLKDRVANVAEFTDALARVAAGGTALDPEVVTQLAARAAASRTWRR